MPGAEEALHDHIHEIQVAFTSAKAAATEGADRALKLVRGSFSDKKEHNVLKKIDHCYYQVKEAWARELLAHYPIVTTVCSMSEEYDDLEASVHIQMELGAVSASSPTSVCCWSHLASLMRCPARQHTCCASGCLNICCCRPRWSGYSNLCQTTCRRTWPCSHQTLQQRRGSKSFPTFSNQRCSWTRRSAQWNIARVMESSVR